MVQFKTKQFSSGEFDVQIFNRIYGEEAVIHWNWFDESQRDIFALLLKIDAIKRNYPNVDITLDAPYLPYMRQDRLFEAGQSVPATVLVDLLNQRVNRIKTMACHSIQHYVSNEKIFLHSEMGARTNNYNYVFPDANAANHYADNHEPLQYVFHKVRNNDGVKLELFDKPNTVHTEFTFLICDDIVAGGRTFVECANALRSYYGDKIKIELMIYHAFLDYGIDNLQQSGISKVHIVNKDSYDYILTLYPTDIDYFNYVPTTSDER